MPEGLSKGAAGAGPARHWTAAPSPEEEARRDWKRGSPQSRAKHPPGGPAGPGWTRMRMDRVGASAKSPQNRARSPLSPPSPQMRETRFALLRPRSPRMHNPPPLPREAPTRAARASPPLATRSAAARRENAARCLQARRGRGERGASLSLSFVTRARSLRDRLAPPSAPLAHSPALGHGAAILAKLDPKTPSPPPPAPRWPRAAKRAGRALTSKTTARRTTPLRYSPAHRLPGWPRPFGIAPPLSWPCGRGLGDPASSSRWGVQGKCEGGRPERVCAGSRLRKESQLHFSHRIRVSSRLGDSQLRPVPQKHAVFLSSRNEMRPKFSEQMQPEFIFLGGGGHT